MTNTINIQVRAFPVTVADERTGKESADAIVLTKQQLQAAQLVGESGKELIYRIYNRQGYRVTDIGKPVKRTIELDLYQHGGEIVAEGGAGADREQVGD